MSYRVRCKRVVVAVCFEGIAECVTGCVLLELFGVLQGVLLSVS